MMYAWNNNEIILPKKEQTMLDLLCTFLMTHKKQTLALCDEICLWRCLLDLLQSDLLTTSTHLQLSLYIKSNFTQTLLDAIARPELYTEYASPMCVVAVLFQYSNMAVVFTNKLESMMDLLAGVCTNLISDDKRVSVEASNLLPILVESYLLVVRRHHNQKLVSSLYTERAFLPCIKGYHGGVIHRHLLLTVARQSLVQREHETQYKAWVKHKQSRSDTISITREVKVKEDKDEKAASFKLADQVFAVIEKSIDTDAVLSFLPDLYAAFVEAYHKQSDDDGASFQMFQFICCLLKIHDPHSSKTLATLTPILATVAKVYDVRADHVMGGSQLMWLQSLAGRLLEMEAQDYLPDWYCVLYELVMLNYDILSPHFIQLWSLIFNHSHQVDGAVRTYQGRLVEKLLTTYVSLRQFPKYITKLLQSIICPASGGRIHWPQGFLDGFRHITALPSGQVIEIWSALLDTIDNLHQHKNERWQQLCQMLYSFFLHFKMADSSSPTSVRSRVSDLEHQTWDLVCKIDQRESEFEEKTKQKAKTKGAEHLSKTLLWRVPICLLTSALCDLHLINSMYKVIPESETSGVVGFIKCSRPADIIHAYNHNAEIISYFKLKWSVQKFCCDAHNMTSQSSLDLTYIDRILAPRRRGELLANQDVPCGDVLEIVQTGYLSDSDDVRQSRVLVAEWRLLVEHLPLLIGQVSSTGHLVHIADILISAAMEHRSGSSDGTHRQWSYDLLTTNPHLAEMTSLHNCLMKALWKQVSEVVVSNSQTTEAARASLCQLLRQESTSAGDLTLVLGTDFSGVTFSRQKLVIITKILQCQPLEDWSPDLKQHSLIGSLVLLHVTSFIVDSSDDHVILWQIISRLLHKHTLFTVCPPSSLIGWLMKLHGRAREQSDQWIYIEKVLQTLVNSALYDDALVEDIKQFSKQVIPLLAADLTNDKRSLRLMASLVHCLARAQRHDNKRVKDELLDLRRQVLSCLGRYFNPDTFMLMSSTCQAIVLRLCELVLSHDDGGATSMWLQEFIINHLDDTDTKLAEACLYTSAVICRSFTKTPLDGDQAFLLKLLLALCEYIRGFKSKLKVEVVPERNNRKRKLSDELGVDTLPAKRVKSIHDDEAVFDQTNQSVLDANSQSGERELPEELQDTLTTVIGALDVEGFASCLLLVTRNIQTSHLLTNRETICASLLVWEIVVRRFADYDEERKTLVIKSARWIFISMTTLERELNTSRDADVIEMVTTLLRVRTTVLRHLQGHLSSAIVSLCYESCQDALCGATVQQASLDHFLSVYQACYRLINTIIMKYSTVVIDSIPAFLGLLQLMMREIVSRSDQSRVSMETIPKLAQAADSLARLLSSLTSHKPEFSKVVPYTLSSYITYLQSVTVAPEIKRVLDSGVHELLSLVTDHGISLLYSALPPSAKYAYKQYHQDYVQFHKFSGGV